MPNISFIDNANDFQTYLNEDEVKAALSELPQEMQDKIYEFADDCVNELDNIEGAVTRAYDAIGEAHRDVEELSSQVYQAESSLDEAASALEL